MKIVLAIAVGGAFGAVARHFALHWVALLLGSTFPWGTLAVNAAGSFVMGALVETMALVWSPALELRAFLFVGFLGAFTTFSTFSLDVTLLYERGHLVAAAAYVMASVILSVAGLFVGLAIVRAALA